ncbi:E3 ubiquitin-protein ligase RMD5 [Vairimorpha necatrix]|uniref:E3 ubiquitin-protein ligase RMD5 n=1 Tax=Vairimorpha necatrix TaxID=6039 RepID=A0AAX4JGG7_9MICR
MTDFDFENLRSQTNALLEELKHSKNQEVLKEKITSLWKNIPSENIQKENEIKTYKYSEETTLYMIIYHLFSTNNEDVVNTFSNEYHAKFRKFILFCINNYKEFVCYTNKFKEDDFNMQNFVNQLGISDDLIFYYNIYLFLTNCDTSSCIKNLRLTINKISSSYLSELKEYLKCLVFPKYLECKKQKVKLKLEYIFKKEFCKLRDFINGDFLPIVFKQGSYGYKLLQENKFMLNNFEDNVMPIEIPIINTRQFHSLFVCPVIKEVCCDENNPVLLECNHVISSSAANILSKYGSMNVFKCPYCPEMSGYEKMIKLNLYD